MPNRLPVAREPRRPVRQEPLVLLLADRKAQIRPLVQTVRALTALRAEEGHDVIAGATDDTPSPTFSTTPAPSWPSTVGAYPDGSAPDAV